MRVAPDAGLLELLRPDGSAAAPGEPGDVVATGFIRQSQPFIRYRVGDVATLSEVERGVPVLRDIVGRLEDVVIGPDGRRTVRFHGIFTELVGCREAQVVQRGSDLLTINVVPDARFSEATVGEIKSRIAARFGPQMRVEVDRVDEIPRTKAGKYKAVVNLMNEQR